MDLQKILPYLRENSRIPLTTLSRKTQIPVDTINNFLKAKSQKIIKRQTILLHFSQIGFPYTILFHAKVRSKDQYIFTQFLKKTFQVNSLYKVIGDFDFIGEAIFRSKKEVDEFFLKLYQETAVQRITYHYAMNEILKEHLFTSPFHYLS